MHKNKTTRLIKKAYGGKFNLDSYDLSPVESYELINYRGFYASKVYPLLAVIQNGWIQMTFAVAMIAFIAGTIFYYNLLVVTEQDVLAAEGRVNTLLQRRNDISINLSKAVYDYSIHERGVFTAIVALRTQIANGTENKKKADELLRKLGNPNAVAQLAAAKQAAIKNGPVSAPGGFLSPLSRLLAVAEQYPDLKLSVAFERLMAALIDVEKDLASERIKYNEAVNIYTTNMARFPINVFAMVFGFEDLHYFETTEDAKKLVPIDY